jgi:hypothetical protein
MQQIQVQLGSLPIILVCLMTGEVAFVKRADFKTIIDLPETGLVAMWDNEGFSITDENKVAHSFDYNVTYRFKDVPVMLQYLKQQNLEMPVFQHNPFGF